MSVFVNKHSCLPLFVSKDTKAQFSATIIEALNCHIRSAKPQLIKNSTHTTVFNLISKSKMTKSPQELTKQSCLYIIITECWVFQSNGVAVLQCLLNA